MPCRHMLSRAGHPTRLAGHDTHSQVAIPRRPDHVATPNYGSQHQTVGCDTKKCVPTTVPLPTASMLQHQEVCRDPNPAKPGRDAKKCVVATPHYLAQVSCTAAVSPRAWPAHTQPPRSRHHLLCHDLVLEMGSSSSQLLPNSSQNLLSFPFCSTHCKTN